jgi:hypothetical protein
MIYLILATIEEFFNVFSSLSLTRKYVLVAIQDEGKYRMTSRGRQALRRIGAKRDVRDYRGSIAMVGQTGGLGRKHIRTVSSLPRELNFLNGIKK